MEFKQKQYLKMDVSFIIEGKEAIKTKIIFVLPIKLAILLLEYVEIA